jgi:hypothetical protein
MTEISGLKKFLVLATFGVTIALAGIVFLFVSFFLLLLLEWLKFTSC